MDSQTPTNQPTKPISDDQELAKVLAGISKDSNNGGLDYEETPAKSDAPAAPVVPPMPAMPPSEPAGGPASAASPAPVTMPDPIDMQMPSSNPATADDSAQVMPAASVDFTMPAMPPMPGDTNLDNIRNQALTELRPLVDKLNLDPEEKFDIYLLLLRSTDDTALIAPAHEAAKNIADEAKRAEALLDVIKEIDFLSTPNTPIAQ